MKTKKGRAKFKNFRILLVSGFSSTIVMGKLIEKLHPEKYDVIQWHTKAGNITTTMKIKVDFTLLALSAMNFVTWKFHVYESANGRHYITLGIDTLT